MDTNRPSVIAIDGRSGAGKSTLALELATLLRVHRPVALFHLEDLYPGWDGLTAGIEAYVTDVLAPLRSGRRARWHPWDWEADAPGAERTTAPAPLVIIEGVGAGASAARTHLDALLWVQVEGTDRKARALARDGEAYAPHWDRWAAQEEAWLATDDVRGAADVTVFNRADGAAPPDALAALLALPQLAGLLRPEAEAAAGQRIHSRRIDCTHPDPVPGLVEALYAGSEHLVVLDSSNHPAPGTADPFRNGHSMLADASGRGSTVFEHGAGRSTISRGCATASVPGAFFDWLDRTWGGTTEASDPDTGSGFDLGWMGWLGYELKRETGGSDVPAAAIPGADAALISPARGVLVDHSRGCVWALSRGTAGSAAWFARVTDAVAALRTSPATRPAFVPPGPVFDSADPRDRYLAKVVSAQQAIHAGDSYEVCLTTRLGATVPRAALDPWLLYRRMRTSSPAPFAHFIRFGSTVVASTSPERFVSLDDRGWMRAEPIKGTRPRGADPVADAALAAELAASPKDRAENIMIVDLLRNDLVRSSDPATLSVPRLCAIETYATVHQMVSTIVARLRPGASRAEAIALAFPPGSMTGAPKISTMSILDRLEDGRARGIYAGAVGYFSHTGAADLAVVIRTLVLRDDGAGNWDLGLSVGGAITADSDPAEEWDEVRTKARGVLDALGSVFPD
ncbi:chorismate-binding protein [Paeniglutamicibacter cryotolerans]|uniref:Anthranilate synthase component 1/para-aminobenzoate synthetase n=1 Tax=Paeniglutamicibacter cryotolerans TaxID=670079 RepID=A0A839QHR3_9MICC|nr:chorismate-binding protein [Paeniglutamicibacter cryotolerans]MBB2994284.1 anthranilate synthase component 1/para-aminobenzoate synthetase [Paeniglutamicibacter cryotolerans]